MKNVVEIKAKRTDAAPGMYGYDAEAVVTMESGEVVYVGVNEYDMFKHYTVSKDSLFDKMTDTEVDEGPERDEAFDKWVESQFVGNGDGSIPEASADGYGSSDVVEYKSLADAKGTEYGKLFDLLNKTIAMMGTGIE